MKNIKIADVLVTSCISLAYLLLGENEKWNY